MANYWQRSAGRNPNCWRGGKGRETVAAGSGIAVAVGGVVMMSMFMAMVMIVFMGMAANGDLAAESASAFFAHIKRSPPN